MARPLSLGSLRAALPAIPPLAPAQPLRGALRTLQTSPPASASRARRILRIRKRTAHIERRAALESERNSGTVDPVLGYVVPDAGPSRVGWSSPWEGCRLQRILLRPAEVYAAPVPAYDAGEGPSHYLPGLGRAEQDMLFGALPHAGLDLRVAAKIGPDVPGETRAKVISEMAEEQVEKVEMLQRVLDLRNANKAGIEVMNRQRVIEEFGRKGKGVDTGSSEVQAALLTQKIRSLADHIMSNPRDNANKRSLRMLVQERARVLAYYRRTQAADKYAALLGDLGLEPRAVEGELRMPF